MKRKNFKYISVGFLIVLVMCCATGCQATTKNFGGTTTLKLEPNEKLEEITWKEDKTLWYLTRPMRDDEKPEVHIFKQKESDSLGILEGTVKVIESRE